MSDINDRETGEDQTGEVEADVTTPREDQEGSETTTLQDEDAEDQNDTDSGTTGDTP